MVLKKTVLAQFQTFRKGTICPFRKNFGQP